MFHLYFSKIQGKTLNIFKTIDLTIFLVFRFQGLYLPFHNKTQFLPTAGRSPRCFMHLDPKEPHLFAVGESRTAVRYDYP